MSVIKFIIGGIIFLALAVFCGKQIKSLIEGFRSFRAKKSSKEVDEKDPNSSDEVVEKGVEK